MNVWPASDIHPVSKIAVTEEKEVYNVVLIRITQIDVSQENYAPIYFYLPFFLAPWFLWT